LSVCDALLRVQTLDPVVEVNKDSNGSKETRPVSPSTLHAQWDKAFEGRSVDALSDGEGPPKDPQGEILRLFTRELTGSPPFRTRKPRFDLRLTRVHF
jgi:hypothetical protein